MDHSESTQATVRDLERMLKKMQQDIGMLFPKKNEEKHAAETSKPKKRSRPVKGGDVVRPSLPPAPAPAKKSRRRPAKSAPQPPKGQREKEERSVGDAAKRKWADLEDSGPANGPKKQAAADRYGEDQDDEEPFPTRKAKSGRAAIKAELENEAEVKRELGEDVQVKAEVKLESKTDAEIKVEATD